VFTQESLKGKLAKLEERGEKYRSLEKKLATRINGMLKSQKNWGTRIAAAEKEAEEVRALLARCKNGKVEVPR
jgi:DNA repair ATPase RecN